MLISHEKKIQSSKSLKPRLLRKRCEIFSLPLIVYLACTIFANNCRSLAFQEGDEATGEMLTVLFMIILVSLDSSLCCPRLYYLLTFVSLSERTERAARAESTSCVLGTPFAREPVVHGLGGCSLAPAPGLPGTPSVYILHIPAGNLLT